jgi:uncharacterized membrane protein
MFWFVVDILTLRKLGLGRPFRYIILALILGCLCAGLIYTYVFLNAAIERSHDPHVHAHSTH